MKIGIVGATGLVGQTFIKVLEEKKIKFEDITFLASERSEGKEIEFNGEKYLVKKLTEKSFDNLDIALFSAGGSVSKKYSPIAAEKGCIVIDNSSAFRMDSSVPLIVPEVNGEKSFENKGIIANPNCSTIQCMAPLKILDDNFSVKRVVYSTYQAVSGSGSKGILDMERGIKGEESKFYKKDIAYNCLPLIDELLENGYSKEEWKMIQETRKILGKEKLQVTATCVRVPVWNGHGVSINIEFEKEFKIEDIKKLLSQGKNLILCDEIPTQKDISGRDEIMIGRIRRDISVENGLSLWVVADNIRKGAASNAIEILEYLMEGKYV